MKLEIRNIHKSSGQKNPSDISSKWKAAKLWDF